MSNGQRLWFLGQGPEETAISFCPEWQPPMMFEGGKVEVEA